MAPTNLTRTFLPVVQYDGAELRVCHVKDCFLYIAPQDQHLRQKKKFPRADYNNADPEYGGCLNTVEELERQQITAPRHFSIDVCRHRKHNTGGSSPTIPPRINRTTLRKYEATRTSKRMNSTPL